MITRRSILAATAAMSAATKEYCAQTASDGLPLRPLPRGGGTQGRIAVYTPIVARPLAVPSPQNRLCDDIKRIERIHDGRQ